VDYTDEDHIMNANSQGFRSFTLSNGMRVNLFVNRSAPLAEVELYVKTGYAWEPDPWQGLSHVVEHNLMHASPKRESRAMFARDRRAMGAWYDAGTSYDYTEYLLLVPIRHLRGAMEMLADGFFSPVFAEAVFKSEMGAILQESRRKEDIPEPMVLEKLYAAAYNVHRRRRWRLGTADGLMGMKIDDLRDYFRHRYGPGNIICTIAGDIDLDEAEAAAREIFGPIPAAEVQGSYSPAEPPQTVLRYLELPSDLERVYWICGFHTPAFLTEPGYHYFDLIASALSGGRGSRLIQRVQNSGLVDRIEARSPEFDEYMMFNVYAETDLDRYERAEQAILTEVFRVAHTGVTAAELNRARTMLEASLLSRVDDLRKHVEWMAVIDGRGGSITAHDEYARLLTQATPADVQAAAADRFTPANLSICVLRPKRAAARASAAVAEAAEKAYAAARSPLPSAAPIEVHRAAPLAVCHSILHRPSAPQAVSLPNGSRLILQATPGNPVFALAAMVKGGRCRENIESCGITDVMVPAMLKGAGGKSGEEIATLFEELGAHLDPVILDDGFGFALHGPAAAFIPATRLLADILLTPLFPADGTENEKRKIINRINAMSDRPRDYSLAMFQRTVFAGHPYGLPWPGRTEIVEHITPPALDYWRKKNVNGANLVLSCAGDVELAAVTDHFANLFANLHRGAPCAAPELERLLRPVPEVVRIEKEFNQTSTIVGYPGAPAHSTDAFALELLSYLCQGDGGRFYDEIRSKRGLAYVVHAVNQVKAAGGSFFGFSATAPDKAEEAHAIFVNEFRKLAEEPPSEEDLAVTKEYCLGQRALRQRRSTLQRTFAMAEAEILGQDYSWELEFEAKLRAVTRSELIRVAREYFPPEGYVSITVGK